MEGKQSPTEIDGGGDNLQNLQNKRKSQSASSSSRCIRQSLENLVSNSSVSLDLSRKDLQHLTEDIYNLFKLKYLHLEGNALSVIPEDFFEQLPNLVWLDLRYNRFKELPSGIGCHKQLKTLLLERNPIKRLPVELGNLTSLTALNLRHCPLEFPPPEVIQKGLPIILSFLRKCKNKNNDYSEPFSPEMPPVEKLNLTDVMKSSLDLSDGWPNEEEMIRFQKLRDEFIQDEKEEYLANNLVANESMPALRRTRTKENVSHKPSMVSSRAKKNMFPIISSHDLIIQSKRIEAYKLAALKEMKEKQALIEQRRKDKEVLQQWRRQTKKMREKQGLLYTFSPEKGDMGVSQHAPYATDNVKYHDKLEGWKEPPRQDENTEKTNINAMKTTDDLRAAKYKEVENRIRQHMLMMKERRKRLTGIPQDDMERAKEDFETVEKLEEEIAEMKRDHHKEYRFTAFTGELPPPSENPLPAPKAQNIFFNMTF
ncbi:leucine-rich repeat-containing protein 27 isoform X2 [Sceloporus undulatus]|uniref:leucine-rich repeat-containing protein 27 isoform X2 n=1 Tax=Sceloporus undulatus TaxID=8520 RepID=UPI001C4CACFA|nr:leucine-rich repeat-containing protein 27 isoform X2 [Sceloporus undulatus]